MEQLPRMKSREDSPNLTSADPCHHSIVMIRGVLLDLAGVVYEGEKALLGALKAVDRLRHTGLPLRFVTNTTRMTKSMVLQPLSRLGLDVTDSDLFTPAQAVREWLARNDCSPSLLVHPNLVQEFEDVPIRAHRAVVVGDAGEAFCYASLNHAFRELIDGAQLIALAKKPLLQGCRRPTEFRCRSIRRGFGICEPT